MPSFFFFFFCLSFQQLVWIGFQFVLLPPFIRKLKMLPVYPGPDLFCFCWPRMGKEHIHCVSFHLMPLWICPNAPLVIYSRPLFLSPFPFSCYGPKKENGSVQALYCTSLQWQSNKKKKKPTWNRTSLREEKREIFKSLFRFLVLPFPSSNTFWTSFALFPKLNLCASS